MRTYFLVIGWLLLGVCPVWAKPNVLLIYTDDHGWPDLGAVGVYQDLKTPNIDALAASGVRATSGYSTAPQCVPSRAGLLIGKSQNRFGVESNGESLKGFDEELTIAEHLKKVGYVTGQIGKWHLGPTSAIPEHGFDDVYSKNANRPCNANYTLAGETIPMQQVNDGLYHLDACSRAAVAFIKRHADQPFFLYLAYRAPHVPLDAPRKYLDRFPEKMPERRRQCLAMLSSMDDGIGEIRAALAAQGLLENTLIFYIGDNGAPLKIHKLDAPGGGPGWDGSLNEPMNGEKGMLAEGGIRVPFLVSWPGVIPRGQVVDTPLVSLDVAATALTLAGADVSGLDGVNLVPYLSGKADAPERALYWRWIAQAAVREGKWKLLRGGERSYLFDLVADPGEKTNLFEAQPEVARRLSDQLVRWSRDMQPPGLIKAGMSEVWEQYFDHYLDGKSARAVTRNTSEKAWVSRGCVAKKTKRGLVITPSIEKRKSRPFIACAGIKNISGPAEVLIRFQSRKPGRVGVAWRSKGQKDFVSEQVQYLETKGSDEFQDHRLAVPLASPIIHLRVLLPTDQCVVHHIKIRGQAGELQEWTFL